MLSLFLFSLTLRLFALAGRELLGLPRCSGVKPADVRRDHGNPRQAKEVDGIPSAHGVGPEEVDLLRGTEGHRHR